MNLLGAATAKLTQTAPLNSGSFQSIKGKHKESITHVNQNYSHDKCYESRSLHHKLEHKTGMGLARGARKEASPEKVVAGQTPAHEWKERIRGV